MDPQANWYPDQSDPALERWWDGSAWTTRTRSIAPTPKVRDPLWRSQKVLLVLVALALVATVTGAVMLGRSAFGSLTAKSFTTPTTVEKKLDAGRYTVFERTGSSSSTGPVTFTENTSTSLSLDDVQVTGPDGEPVSVRYPGINETITRGNAVYSGAVQFTAERAGRYSVQISGQERQVLLTRTLFDGAARGLILLLSGAATGGICATAFVVIVLVKASRRKRLAQPGW